MKKTLLALVALVSLVSLAENRAWCRVADDPTRLVYAPDLIWPSWQSPNAADYRAAGYAENAVAAPTNAPGMVARLERYEARDGRVVAIYRYEPEPPKPPRRWTPLSLKRSAQALGLWDALKAFLVAADAYDDFIMAQFEAEDDAQFVALLTAARERFGDATVDAILDGAETE